MSERRNGSRRIACYADYCITIGKFDLFAIDGKPLRQFFLVYAANTVANDRVWLPVDKEDHRFGDLLDSHAERFGGSRYSRGLGSQHHNLCGNTVLGQVGLQVSGSPDR